jgi:hypothetical protein
VTRKIRFVVPEAPAPAVRGAAPQRRLAGGGIRLGLLDNNKGNADHLLAITLEALRAALPIASVVSLKKPTAVLPAPAEILDQLTREADCVISAMAD